MRINIARWRELWTTQRPQRPEGWTLLSGFWLAAGQSDSALQAVAKGLEVAPDYPPLQLRRGMLKFWLGRPIRGVLAAEKSDRRRFQQLRSVGTPGSRAPGRQQTRPGAGGLGSNCSNATAPRRPAGNCRGCCIPCKRSTARRNRDFTRLTKTGSQ